MYRNATQSFLDLATRFRNTWIARCFTKRIRLCAIGRLFPSLFFDILKYNIVIPSSIRLLLNLLPSAITEHLDFAYNLVSESLVHQKSKKNTRHEK